MGQENKLYLYMVNDSIENIVNDFWLHAQLVEYNQDTKEYKCMVPLNPEHYIQFKKEKDLFDYMDEQGYQFITDNNVMGGIWKSYPMAILEGVRWMEDVRFAMNQYKELVRGE